MPELSYNIDFHQHACGEYVLDQLQNGRKPEEVVECLYRDWLVKTTVMKLKSYRKYREQQGNYWTPEKLEHAHWAWLYERVTLESVLVARKSDVLAAQARHPGFRSILEDFCARMELSEEVVPTQHLRAFFVEHQEHAQLHLRYPEARLVRDALPWTVVEEYRALWRRDGMEPGKSEDAVKARLNGYHTSLVEQGKFVVWPKMCADACCTAAWATLSCEDQASKQIWERSLLTSSQRTHRRV